MLPDVASRMHLVNARCLCMPRRIDHQSEDRQSGLPSASLRRAASLLIDRRRMGMKNDRDAKKPPGQCRSFRVDSDPTLAQRDQHGPKTVFLRLRTASLVQPGPDDWIRSCPLPDQRRKRGHSLHCRRLCWNLMLRCAVWFATCSKCCAVNLAGVSRGNSKKRDARVRFAGGELHCPARRASVVKIDTPTALRQQACVSRRTSSVDPERGASSPAKRRTKPLLILACPAASVHRFGSGGKVENEGGPSCQVVRVK